MVVAEGGELGVQVGGQGAERREACADVGGVVTDGVEQQLQRWVDG